MKIFKTMLIVLSVAVSALALNAGGQAGEYGIFTLRNPTNDPINYQVKWGEDGEWQSFTLEPGYSRGHYHSLDAFATAPRPFIRFDYIVNDARVTYKTYHQQFFASPRASAADGKSYTFRISRDGALLDLFAD